MVTLYRVIQETETGEEFACFFPVRNGSAKTGLMKILKIILNRIFTSNRNFSGKGGNPFPV